MKYLIAYSVVYICGVFLAYNDKTMLKDIKAQDKQAALQVILIMNVPLLFIYYYIAYPILFIHQRVMFHVTLFLIKRKVNKILKDNNIKPL